MTENPETRLDEVSTHDHGDEIRDAARRIVPALTVLAHPDCRRIGERVALASLLTASPQPLSRLEPDFTPPAGGPGRPLNHVHLSRRPILLRADRHAGLVIERAGSPTALIVDGEAVENRWSAPAERLDHGVVILLGQQVALLFHALRPSPRRPRNFGLVGESDAMVELRRQVERLASRGHTVLLRGETGTGKELVARALHDESSRRAGPYRAVNLGAVPAELAAAELFGSVRGSFTGAGAGRIGYFEQADGGTLFLDEIGAAPSEVQNALLRVLETGELQPVGAARSRRVDVRVIAATDSDLEAAAQEHTFRAPLLHRLAAFPIHLPPLRRRRDDIGRLLLHFLCRELDIEGRRELLRPPEPNERPWLAAEIVARLALYDWPGNVRELKNVTSQLVLHNLDRAEMEWPAGLEKSLQAPAGLSPSAELFDALPYRDVRELGREELEIALERHGFEPSQAAAELGVARPSLYKRLKALGVATAASLSADVIRQAASACKGDTRRMAERLRVSEHGLKIRMKNLGLR